MTIDFQGKDRLVQALDAAVEGDCPDTITTCLRRALCGLVGDPEVQLPECVHQVESDHYARRELHRDPGGGYSVMAMTWGPGQSTPIHDHCGMWCVEAVWHGQIEVVQYELMEQRGDRYRFEPRTTMRAGVGSAGSLIPPHEYHTIWNPDSDEAAVTLHIYAGKMTRCSVFRPEAGGWYRREERKLHLDAA